MADKKISELDLALLINNDAVFPMSQDNAGEPTTFKVGITQLGTEIAEDMTFSNLRTTSKKLVGAINELLSLGSPIIIGTTAPTSSIGADGNIYVQYTEGTGGADDEVDGIFVKIDGAWCEISTGGGSGTSDYDDLSNKPQVNSIELVGNKSLDDLGIMPSSLSKTVSGSIAHFTDGADNIPVKSLVSEIVAVESGSGEKSPDNPYTISGFDSGIITDTDNDQITNTYTFVFGQTVYGGHFDNKGNLAIAKAIIDLGSLSWTYHAPSGDVGAFFDTFLPSNSIIGNRDIAFDGNIGIYNIIPSKDIALSGYDNNVCALANATRRFITCDQRFTDATSYKNAMNGVMLAYPLANPITLEITTQDIPTLLGDNNIFSNCGDVEVDYYTDNADEIVEVVKATASTPLHNYSTDEQVIGTWIDGSTIYERVFDLGSDVSIANDTLTDTTIDASSMSKIMYAVGLYSTGVTLYPLMANINNNLIRLQSDINGNAGATVRYVILQYTKSST